MAKTINTAQMKVSTLTEADLRREQADYEKNFANEEYEEVTIPKVLAKQLGNPYYWALNGVVVGFELGVPKRVPKPIAEHIKKMLNELQ